MMTRLNFEVYTYDCYIIKIIDNIITIMKLLICYCYHFIPSKFFILALTGSLLLESDWWQSFSDLEESSEYLSWSQHYCNLDGLGSSNDFYLFQSSKTWKKVLILWGPFQVNHLQIVSKWPSLSTPFLAL